MDDKIKLLEDSLDKAEEQLSQKSNILQTLETVIYTYTFYPHTHLSTYAYPPTFITVSVFTMLILI